MATTKQLNAIKQDHYRQCAEKRKAAFRAKCYYECMLIDYAMIEDRLLSILAHAGLVDRKDEIKPSWSRKTRAERRALLGVLDLKYVDAPPRLRTISNKLMVLRHLCEMELGSLGCDSLYAKWLDEDARVVLKECDVLGLCKQVGNWCQRRNVYVHALFGSAEYGSGDEELRAFAEEGRELAAALNKVSGRLRTAEKRFEKRKIAAYKAQGKKKKA